MGMGMSTGTIFYPRVTLVPDLKQDGYERVVDGKVKVECIWCKNY
jgi:hypothetical protein